MTWIEFLGWQKLVQKRSIEKRNAQEREARGLDPRAPGPSSDEWAAFQAEQQARGVSESG